MADRSKRASISSSNSPTIALEQGMKALTQYFHSVISIHVNTINATPSVTR